ncbi:serine hydrolase domain-containing protein [Streptomyces sp. NPDC052020]|uniref:serine hydrolase domain-containing protein n=1 Tax=Streptomyces sp. NPDC052020 TaxID=3155677 RepID=UPI003420F500
MAEASRGPGAAIALTCQGTTTTLCLGHTDRTRHTPVTAHTRFEIGSVTKTFTALLAATLAADGTIDLDRPLADHIPALLPKEPHARRITARHLAIHTSGLPRLPPGLLRRALPHWYTNPYQSYTPDHLATLLPRTRLRHPPGRRTRYSNLGVGLLGHYLTHITGVPYPTLLHQRVLRPLGLTQTDDQPREQATGHYRGRPCPPWLIPALPAAGALRSSTHDLLHYLCRLLDPSTAAPASLATGLRTVLHPGPGQEPLVWFRRTAHGYPLYFHAGGTRGHTAFIGLLPHQQVTLTALTNSGAPTNRRFAQAAYALLYHHCGGIGSESAGSRSAATEAPARPAGQS